MRILFIFVCGLVLLPVQLSVRWTLFGIPFGFDLVTLLVIFVGFHVSFFAGSLGLLLVSFVAEVFSFLPHGSVMTTNLLLFLGIHLVKEQIFTEAYLTKALWAFLFSFVGYGLIRFVAGPDSGFFTRGDFWEGALIQSGVNGLLGFFLFILLDRFWGVWLRFFSRRQASVTGADLFQVKSDQRKYF